MKKLLIVLAAALTPAVSHAEALDAVYFSPDGKYFAASFDDVISVGAVKGRKFTNSIGKDEEAKKGNWTFLGFTPDSRRLAVYYHWTSELRFLSLKGEFLSSVRSASPYYASDRLDWLVESRQEGGVSKYSLSHVEGEAAAPKFSLPDQVTSASFSPDGKLLAFTHDKSAGGSRAASTMDILALKSGKYLKREARRGSDYLGDVSFSPDGRLLAYSENGTTVRVVRPSDWKEVGSVSRGGTPPVRTVFSPGGAFMAVDYAGWALRVYSLPDFKVVLKRDFEGANEWSISDMKFSRDGSFLALLGSVPKAGARSAVKFIELPLKGN